MKSWTLLAFLFGIAPAEALPKGYVPFRYMLARDVVCSASIGTCSGGGGGGSFNGGTVTGATLFTARVTFGSAVDAANAVDLNETAGCLTIEGSSADAFETRLCTVNPTADRTVNIADEGGTVLVASGTSGTGNQTKYDIGGDTSIGGSLVAVQSTGYVQVWNGARIGWVSAGSVTVGSPGTLDTYMTRAAAGVMANVPATTVASAATITATANIFHVSGTTNIDNVTNAAAYSGTRITLIFDGVLTVGDGTGNLKLAGGFTTTADDTLTLVSDGTSWFEVARAIN